jgi:hypothetical protein
LGNSPVIAAVIGHGRSPEGKGWGVKIDACDAVVRMWEWQWQAPADYGTKYDYGLFTVHPAVLPVFRRQNRRRPRLTWLAYRLSPFIAPPENCQVIDPAEWLMEAVRLGGSSSGSGLQLTRGTAAACWTMTSLSVTDLVLVGFDNIYLGTQLPWDQAFSPDYSDLYFSYKQVNRTKPWAAGCSKSVTHDLAVERPLMESIAKRRLVSLQFAQDFWP